MVFEILKHGDINPQDEAVRIAFVLNPDNFTIHMEQGCWHGDILYEHNLSSRDYCYGGVVRQGKLYPHTGTVQDIPEKFWNILLEDLSETLGRKILLDQ